MPRGVSTASPWPGNTKLVEDESLKRLAILRTYWKWAAFSQFFFTFRRLFPKDIFLDGSNIFLSRVETTLLSILGDDKKHSAQKKRLPILVKIDSIHDLAEQLFRTPLHLRSLMKIDKKDTTWRLAPVGYDAKFNAYWFIEAPDSKPSDTKRARQSIENTQACAPLGRRVSARLSGARPSENRKASAQGSGSVGEEDDQFVEWETICITLLDWEHITASFQAATHAAETALYEVLVTQTALVARKFRRMERQRQSDEAVLHRKQSARLAKKREQGSVLARRPSETNENRATERGERRKSARLTA
ncbi:hypothetical protein B0H14DRAFT_2795254 [Mycena olivaceomarginata]|nr:hypothetical protein B0H14DRAFT_2795254 [Mycena olivaceomarginata]